MLSQAVDIIERPPPVDIAAFDADSPALHAKYGLPREVVFCRRCVISNQRPNSAVEFAHTARQQEGDDPLRRRRRLRRLPRGRAEAQHDRLGRARASSCASSATATAATTAATTASCPGSGGKDSFYAAHVLKHKYGMHPLTVTWAPHIYTDWGWRTSRRWIHAGFDNYLMHAERPRAPAADAACGREPVPSRSSRSCSGRSRSRRRWRCCTTSRSSSTARTKPSTATRSDDADRRKRDWSLLHRGRPERRSSSAACRSPTCKEHFGVDAAAICCPTCRPTRPQIEEKNVEVHYLGYYLQVAPAELLLLRGRARRLPGLAGAHARAPTASTTASTTGSTTSTTSRRSSSSASAARPTTPRRRSARGDITRDEGVALVQRFDGEFPERFADEIFRYLSIAEKEFPEAASMFEQPIMDRAVLHASRRPLPLAAPVAVRRTDEWKLRHTGSSRSRPTPVLWLTSASSRGSTSRGRTSSRAIHLEGLRVIGDPQHLRSPLLRGRRRRAALHGHRGEPVRPQQPRRHRSPDGRGRLRPDHGRRRHALARRRREMLRSGADKVAINTAAVDAAGADHRGRQPVRLAVHGAVDRGQAARRRQRLGGLHRQRPRATPASTWWSGRSAPSSSAPARSC